MKAYGTRNPLEWLDGRLRELYAGTEGPHGSPDPVECYLLWHAAAAAGGDVLEIGSWRGRSSCFLADAVRQSGRKAYCLDWWQGDHTGGAFPDREAMEKSLASFGLSDAVVIMDGDSRTFDYTGVGPFSMVFYDADHGTEPTVQSILNAKPVIAVGAEVWLHDAGWQTSQRAIDQLCNHGFERSQYFNVWEGLAVIRRVS
jgi:predicted O-methyltransferase YrrM